jgi:hypothetical protein
MGVESPECSAAPPHMLAEGEVGVGVGFWGGGAAVAAADAPHRAALALGECSAVLSPPFR